jgi:hypothetical protein
MSRVFCAFSFACGAKGLAGVASANNIGALDFLPVNFFNVAMIDHLWPVFF